MRMTLVRAAVFAALMGSMLWIPAVAGASGGFGAATVQVLAASPGVTQGQQPSPTDAPTGPTPAPTGTATPAESSPPPPGGPSNTGTAQTNDSTALVIGAAIILIVLLVAFFLWKRRGSVRDL
jgi:LPXTG-motif cell wall-anchored protein